MTQADIARRYRKEYGNEMPSSQLASIMYEKEKHIFTSVDTARYALRYIEGKTGARCRKGTEKTGLNLPNRTPSPYFIPQPDGDDLEPFKLPTSWNRFLLAGDFHIPNHRKEPIEAMINYAKEKNIRKLFLNGDLLDNTPFTRWMREPLDKGDVKRWFDMAKEFLRYLKQHFDEIYWAEGNHDFWYKRYLMQKAPELFGDAYYDLENRLSLNEIGIKFISQNYLIKAGKLNIHHGHITFRGGGSYANAARMLYMKTKANMICSHVHVESSHTEPDLNDTIVTTFTTGCMCTLRPEYQPFGDKACHGFADITIKNNRDFSVDNKRIYKGQIL
jgi:predicted phosphodiesterase